MKFTHTRDDGTKIEFDLSDDLTIDQILEHFQAFMIAVGYHIPIDECLVFEKME